MRPETAGLSREERLAQRLRENLHRRKAQARALASGESVASESQTKTDLSKS
ncbi:hypothetical protein Y88_2183 [Novosphingobium nitrogenifigens DSM 19370]|uniref:Uncharacterized protein n=2 Tax=Novosphingobium nitrogenifigens TaxID=378548 RepID=F1Z5D1_9SPHN|nr:hypothetical protein Y88_2183 [Novosphingobium nitrogenifigens DSM 19370]